MQNDLIERDAPNYASAKFPTPRAFQDTAHQKLRDGAKAGHKNQLVMAPTGAGKSYLGMRIAHETLLRGNTALFVCDRTTLINQTSAVADSYGLSAHGIIQSNHWRTDLRLPFQIASVQTLARRQWPDVDVIIVDECFPGDTLIDTPRGKSRIDTLNKGDLIYNSCGEAQIVSVFSKVVSATVKVRLSNGTTVECTRDHPFFTEMGWRPAGSLERGARLFCREDVQGLWGGDAPVHHEIRSERGAPRVRESFCGAGMLREILLEEIEKPNAQSVVTRKDGSHAEADWTRAEGSRRKWERPDGYSEEVHGNSKGWMDCGVCREDPQECSAGLSTSLQNRHCASNDGNSRGTGWGEPLLSKSQAAGREEGCASSFAWVESVEDVKQESGIRVYNLRVRTHPSYFANGVLVHNCHTQYSAWTEHVMTCKAKVIGLSATPFSAGLGKLFSNMVNAATMHDLTESGVLVPMRVFSCTKADMTGAATAGGEWTDKSAEERGMEIIGDVVTEWVKLASQRKTIVFGATIAHCEEICRQFNEAGVMAAVFTSKTPDGERKVLLSEYEKSDSAIRVLISVEALAKGFDVKDVECVCDCRPLRKSLSTAIQMWGRGLRSSPETGKTDCYLLDFSGNIIRFADDYSDIFFNGLDELDCGEKLDKAIRRDNEDKPEGKSCPECGYNPMGKRCISCGHEVHSSSLVEHLPGEMQEIMLGKKKLADDARHLWEQVCTYARAHSSPEKQYWRAAYLYKEMFGTLPPKTWGLNDAANVPISRNVLNKIKANNIAFSHRRAA